MPPDEVFFSLKGDRDRLQLDQIDILFSICICRMNVGRSGFPSQ